MFCQHPGMRGVLFLALFCFGWIVALPAFAASTTAPSTAPIYGAGVLKEPSPGTAVEMPYLIAPVVVDEKLVAYAYVSSNIIAASPSAAIDIRDKTPFIQDAYVRDVNATPIGMASDPATVDGNALAIRMLADARKVVGASKAVGVKIITIQMSAVQPNG
jgi:hypothetical protein